MNFEDVIHVRIRVKLLSSNSNYSIRLSETVEEISLTVFVIIIAVGILVPCGIFICCLSTYAVLMIVWSRKNRIRESERTKNQTLNQHLQRKVEIDETLQGMKKDYFKNIHSKYKEESCVVCLEEFDSTSIVIKTNE